jgi:uncharacterized protein (DUF4213/DUF364 family)
MSVNKREEPLKYFYQKYGFDISRIKRIAAGEKYLGLMIDDGRIGVCATLRKRVNVGSMKDKGFPDLDNHDHRLIYTAYLNALLNYESDYNDEKDIFDFINFGSYKKVVMIGDFRPLVKKFRQSGLNVSVFDLYSDSEVVIPIEHREKYLGEADGVILTATSIFNDTFVEILKSVNEKCDVFLLGPTAILDKKMKEYRNVKVVFGTVFKKNDHLILDIIADNEGTRHFQKFGKKVYI